MYKETIQELESYQWSFIALPLKAKATVNKWTHLQTALPTKEEIVSWGQHEQNIAVITGSLSGVCVLDVDEFTPEVNDLISKLPPTWTVETGTGGLHYYFKYPRDKELRNFTKKMPGLDFRGEGGYVITAGSIHPNGNLYKWVYKTESINDLAEFPFELLKNCFNENGSNKPKVVEILQEEQIPEGQRNDSLYIIAQQLHTAFPKEKGLAWQLFNSFAKDKCQSTYLQAFGKGELGSIFNSASKSHIASEALSQYKATTRAGGWANPMSIEELLASNFPPPTWIVDKLFIEEGIGILSGDPASYKTFLFLDLAISVALGTSWLGNFETKQQKVWIIDKESTIPKLKQRIQYLKNGKVAWQDKKILLSSDQLLTVMADGKMWDQSLEKAADLGVNLILLDSFRRFLPGTENDSEITNRFFSHLAKCRSFGISVLLTHHHRKKVKDESQDATSMIRGSSDILSNLDTHLVVEKQTEGDLLKLTPNKIKDGEPISPFAVRRIEDLDGLRFEYQGDSKNFTFDTKAKEWEKVSKYILDTLKDYPIGMYKSEIEEHTVKSGYTKNAFATAFQSLRKQQILKDKRTGLPGPGYEVKYYI